MADPKARSRRRRLTVGADCLSCSWFDGDPTRAAARAHAQENPGHAVHFVVEETTVYEAEASRG